MSKLLIGWSEVSITPDKKVGLAGQFFERISEYVETPVTVTAMAVESGAEQMVICSCDLVSIGDKLIQNVRERLPKNIGLDPQKIILNATHTHTSLKYSRGNSTLTTKTILDRYLPAEKRYKPKISDSGNDVMGDEEALEFLSERVTEVVSKAWQNRKSASFSCGFGRAVVGMCRRVCYDDGSTKMWGDTNSPNFTNLEGGNDSGIEIMYIFDENKKLTGVVANVACPSQVVEHRSFISSDYWGKVKIYLREKFGNDLYVLGLCSAAGDQCPRDLVRWVNPETPIDDPNIKRENYIERRADTSMFDINGTKKIGKRIANEIISVYEELSESSDEVDLIHKTLNIDLPFRRVTPEQYAEADRALKDYAEHAKDNANFADNAMMHVYAGAVMRFEKQKTKDIVTIEVHIIKFGDIVIATNPFELFLDYGNQIRARSKARQTFLIQLACGSSSYLPTEKAEKGGHYSAYVSSGVTGHVGGEMLVRKTVEEINNMF